jgi:GT2 family glycosyltransferase
VPADATIVLAPDGGSAGQAPATDVRLEMLGHSSGTRCGFTVHAPDPDAGALLGIELTALSDTGAATQRAHLPPAPTPRPPADEPATRLADLAGRGATVLDVDGVLQGSDATRTFDLFAPPLPGVVPPMLPDSVDVVVLRAAGGELDPAVRSVARLGVLVDDDGTLTAEALGTAAPARRVSALVPAYGDPHLTDLCLAALLASRLPPGVELEVVAIDDQCPENSREILSAWARRDARMRADINPRNLGFLGTTNRAAKLATGDVLVMVNNDAFVEPDALAALLEGLDRPGVGVAGGSFVWPDGRLQEAGGAVFRDGSAWHLGGGGPNPLDPLYAAWRPADYCSGALLALTRATWDQLGGLDTEFDPGEYEDVDLCFRARAAGLGVLCVPAARATHHMRSLWRGPTSHQERFLTRWRDVLAGFPERPEEVDRPAQRELIAGAAARCPAWPPAVA